MRFLVDECCPRQLAEALRNAAHDVRYVVDSHPREDDRALLALASMERRIVITADYDFGERVIRLREDSPGVVLLAPSTERVTTRVERIVEALALLGGGLVGHLTILDRERVRRRPLSFGSPELEK